MAASEYLAGAGFFLLMLGGTGVAAGLVARLQPTLPPAARVAQVGVLWLAAVLAAHLLPGMVGVLDRVSVSLTSVVLALGAYAATRGRFDRGPTPSAAYPDAEAGDVWSWLVALVAVLATVVVVAALGVADALRAPFHVDVTSFHLPNVARWIQSGTLWQVDDFIPDRSPGNYPQTGDVFSLAAMLPWSADFLVRFVNYPLLILTGTGTYVLCRELRVPAPTAMVATAAFTATPIVAWVSFAGLSDTGMLAGFAPGCAFLLRYRRSASRMDLFVAGLALGLSFGTRWYAVPAVAIVVGIWVAARLAAGEDRRRVLVSFLALSGLVTLAGGFWLLRNWVASGNPVFPVNVALLGVTIFEAPRDVFRDLEGFTIAHYAGQPAIWREYFLPGFLRAMGFTSALLWVGLVLSGCWALLIARRARRAGEGSDLAVTVIAMVAAAALIGVAYTITPYSAVGPPDDPAFAWVNARYVVPALVLGVACTAWAITHAGRWRRGLELVMLIGTLDGLRRIVRLDGPDPGVGDVLVVALALVVGIAIAGAGYRARGSRRLRPVAAAALAVGVGAMLAAGLGFAEAYERDRYANVSDPISYIRDRAPEGQEIGFVGEGWGNYPFMGPRLRNDLRFVGKRVRGTYRNYGRRDRFAAALRRGRFGLVVFHDFASIDVSLPARQEGWLREMGYRPIATGPNPFGFNRRVTVYAPPSRFRR